MTNIQLIVTDNLTSARQVIYSEGLNEPDTAVIYDACYLDYITIRPKEKIYITTDTSPELLQALLDKSRQDLSSLQSINLSLINTIS